MSPLLRMLIDRGYQLIPEGSGNFRIKGHQGLIVKENYWFHHALGRGGNARQLLHFLDIPMSATDMLGHPEKGLDFKRKPYIMKERTLHAEFLDHTEQVEAYLVQHRGIDIGLVQDLFRNGLIREDSYHNACFLGYNAKGALCCVSRRAISPNGRPQKSELTGSDKRYAFCIPGEPQADTLIIAEGPIDILSIACMENWRFHRGYYCTHKIASCGGKSHQLLARINHFHPKKIWLALDNDPPGRTMTREMQMALQSVAEVGVVSYPYGKDPNDWWLHRIRQGG